MAYQCYSAEQVGIVQPLPIVKVGLRDGLHGGQGAVVDDNAVQPPKRFDSKLCHLGCDLKSHSKKFRICLALPSVA